MIYSALVSSDGTSAERGFACLTAVPTRLIDGIFKRKVKDIMLGLDIPVFGE